jgi:hypothetical protein
MIKSPEIGDVFELKYYGKDFDTRKRKLLYSNICKIIGEEKVKSLYLETFVIEVIENGESNSVLQPKVGQIFTLNKVSANIMFQGKNMNTKVEILEPSKYPEYYI